MDEKPKRVVLIFPRMRYSSGDPPIGIATIASFLRENGVAVTIIDTTFDRSRVNIRQKIARFNPDFIGVYVDTLMYNDALELIRLLRHYRIPIIAGGPHTTILPETIIQHVDIAVIGEGELPLLEIIRRYPDLSNIPGIWYAERGEIKKNPSGTFIQDLDSLPFPAFDLLDMKQYLKTWHYLDSMDINLTGTNILTSRGCPFSCTYCQPTLDILFGKKIRRRSPANVVEEIKLRMRQLHVKSFFFHDDTFTFDKSWLDGFCEEIRKNNLKIVWGCNTRVDTVDEPLMRKMYKAGLRNLHIGIESGNNRIVNDIYKKGIDLNRARQVVREASRVGISSLCFFMLGAPTETKEEIENTLRYAAGLKCQEVTFSITSPFPMTYLYDMVKENGYEIKSDFGEYNYYHGRSFAGKGMSLKELSYYQKKGLAMFYLHPSRWGYVMRHVTSVNGWRKMMEKATRFVK